MSVSKPLKPIVKWSRGKKDEIKKFIEYILHHDFDELENIFMNTYFSIDDLRNVNQEEYMFTQKEILRGEHEYYFIARSQFMRNISYYNEYDPLQRYKLD